MGMMLRQEATPAQIGAFLIAHRIRRPTGEELAGMLDAYTELGCQLKPIPLPPFVLGSPYDGRSRTAPVSPLTGLILAAAGVPTILHGGDQMPTKEGVPLITLWQGLGVNWQNLTLEQVQSVLEMTNLGFIYLPHHFPLAEGLVPYRREIGKRPPVATLELIWIPYSGEATLACGYVHPPTESMIRDALQRRQVEHYITVKGLEGSCDLPRDRTCIIGVHHPVGVSAEGSNSETSDPPENFERLLLHPSDYGFGGKEVPLESAAALIHDLRKVIAGEAGELMQAVIWNGGFYLWQAGACSDLASGLSKAELLIMSGQVATQLETLQQAVDLKSDSY